MEVLGTKTPPAFGTRVPERTFCVLRFGRAKEAALHQTHSSLSRNEWMFRLRRFLLDRGQRNITLHIFKLKRIHTHTFTTICIHAFLYRYGYFILYV